MDSAHTVLSADSFTGFLLTQTERNLLSIALEESGLGKHFKRKEEKKKEKKKRTIE